MKRDQTVADIAEVFNVNEESVRRWCAQGMPHKKVGRIIKLNDGEVQAWLSENNRSAKPGRPPKQVDPEADKATEELGGDKDYWLARKYRLQCLKEEGKLVDREEYKAEWMRRIQAAKSKLIGMPAEIAPALYGQEVASIEHQLRERIEQIIREIAESSD